MAWQHSLASYELRSRKPQKPIKVPSEQFAQVITNAAEWLDILPKVDTVEFRQRVALAVRSISHVLRDDPEWLPFLAQYPKLLEHVRSYQAEREAMKANRALKPRKPMDDFDSLPEASQAIRKATQALPEPTEPPEATQALPEPPPPPPPPPKPKRQRSYVRDEPPPPSLPGGKKTLQGVRNSPEIVAWKREVFAQCIARGIGQCRSATMAHMCASKGSALLQDPEIVAMIESFRQKEAA